MKTLGLDIGSKRIGLAVSDEEGTFAFPTGKLDRKGRKQDLATLCEMIAAQQIEEVVVGLPVHLDGGRGTGARAAQDFADALGSECGIPVATLDERLTSVEAERVLRAGGKKQKQSRPFVDAVAASIILRTYLDMRENQRARGDEES